ncbi:alpha/beta hydrolase [Caballeronia temeraria]|uniref:Alpha/beta hydrolase n=1 Tax=Caballeronia temeraria TaxID=1777137 RepID=A0A158AT13_9BURK|nr:alpha/beta hydrolase [Caballeronia temeraria]SAK61004.1 alpha/beta hydrolase [Caballeronia temeraria]
MIPSLRVLVAPFIAMLSACSPAGLVNALTPHSTYELRVNIPYEAGDRHSLDVYSPRRPQSSGAPSPLIVFFYGGSWQTGDRKDYLFVGEALAARGYVTVIPDYRRYPQTIFPGFMDDAAAAVAWAQAHAIDFHADPQRIFLMGHSAGAHIAMLLATDRRYLAQHGVDAGALAGVVGLAGPYDFLPLQDPTLEQIFPMGTRKDSQPINHVDGAEPPIFLGVGMDDHTVDPGNTTRFAARLEAFGDRFELKSYAGINHAMIVGSFGRPVRSLSGLITVAPVLDDVSRFIDSLDGGQRSGAASR